MSLSSRLYGSSTFTPKKTEQELLKESAQAVFKTKKVEPTVVKPLVKAETKPVSKQTKTTPTYGTKGFIPKDLPVKANPFMALANTAALKLPESVLPGYKQALQQAEKESPIATTIASGLGYLSPGSIGVKAIKPLLAKAGTGIGKQVTEGAIVGTGITTAENIVPLLKGEKDLKQVGKEVATGLVTGAALDVGLFKLGKLAKPLLDKIAKGVILSQAEKQIVAKQANVPVGNVDKVVENYRKTLIKGEGLTQQTVKPLLRNVQPPQQLIKPSLDTNIEKQLTNVTGDSMAFKTGMEETSIPLPKTTPLTIPKQQEPKIAKVMTELPTKTKIPMVEKGAKVYQSLVSTDLPLERLGRANEKVSNLASTNRKVTGSVDYVLANKMTDNEGNEVGKSLFDVFKDVPQENKSDLFEYALQKHNIRRFEEGKPVFGDAVDSSVSQQRLAELQAKNPELETQSKKITGYMNNLMENWALKSGLVNYDSLRILREKYPDYVPTYRLKDTDKAIMTGGSKGNVSSTIKKAKGSSEDILPLDQQMAMLTNKVIRASRKNELYNSIYDAFDNNPEFVERFFKPISTEKADLTDGIESIVKDYDEPIKKVGDTYELNFYRNGEKVKAQISADLFEAIKPLQEATGVEALGEIVRKYATNPFKALITQYNPIFVARNIMRDIPTAFIYSNDAIEWSKQMPVAFKEIASNGKAWKEYQALGGTRSGIFSYDKGVNTPFKGKKDNLLVRGARGTLNAVETANNLTETLPRFAEYLATVKKGNNSYDSKLQGIMRASEITTDFTRSGKVTKGADAFIPYLNPSVQGIDRFARLAAKKPLQTALKGGLIITVPTVILDQINKDNKAYKEINEREKNQYYLIPDGSGKFARIPKSRETGVIFSTVFDWIARRSRGEEVTPKEIVSTIKENFSPVNPFENSIITPLLKGIEQIKDPERDVKNYAGISLVPSSLKKYEPKEQYDQYTSYVSKELGSLAGVSPKVIDYLIRSYTGILGQTLMPKTSASQRGVVEAAFKTDPVFKSGLPNKFYDILEKQTQELNKQKREEKEKGTKIERDLEKSVKALNKVSKDIAEFRKMQKEIDALSIPQEEKDRRIRELQKSMNDLARKVVEGAK